MKYQKNKADLDNKNCHFVKSVVPLFCNLFKVTWLNHRIQFHKYSFGAG